MVALDNFMGLGKCWLELPDIPEMAVDFFFFSFLFCFWFVPKGKGDENMYVCRFNHIFKRVNMFDFLF